MFYIRCLSKPNVLTLHILPPASSSSSCADGLPRGGELFLTMHLAENWGVSCAIRGGHFIPIFVA